jgi:hypothetical protein
MGGQHVARAGRHAGRASLLGPALLLGALAYIALVCWVVAAS